MLIKFLISIQMFFAHSNVLSPYKDKNILLKTVEADPVAFQIFTFEHPDYLVWGEKLDHDSTEIQKNFEKGKFSYMENNLVQSRDFFNRVEQLRLSGHFSEGTKNLINYSLLRLAQFSRDDREQNKYLLEAISFETTTPIDESLFPPELLQKYFQLKKKNQKKFYILPNLAEKFDWVWINGEKQKIISSFFASTPGTKLITLTSPNYLPETFEIDPDNLKKMELKHEPVTSLDCSLDEISPKIKYYAKSFKVFGRSHCLSQIKNHLQNSDLNKMNIENQRTNFWSNKYIWLGLGVLITGFGTYYLNSNQSKSNTPQPPPDGVVSIQTN